MIGEKRQEQFDPLQKAYKERVVTGFGAFVTGISTISNDQF